MVKMSRDEANRLNLFLKILSGIYFCGAALHFADLLDFRLKFSEMDSVWRCWIVYLMVFDFFAAIGLWQKRDWGVALFLIIASSQLIVYVGFPSLFGAQYPLVAFHLITIFIFIGLKRHLKAAPIIQAIVLMFVLASCQSMPTRSWTPQDLLVSENESLRAPTQLSRKMIKEDVSFLVYALESGYGGRKFVPQETFTSAMDDLRKISEQMNSEQLKDRIDAILLRIPDNHLRAKLNGKSSTLRLASADKGTVGKNAISDPKQIWEVRLDRKGNLKVLFISITAFRSSKDPVWIGFIDQVKKGLKASDLLVLDLRGNGGGDDWIGYELAKLLHGNAINNPSSRQYISQTPQTLAIAANGFRVSSIELKQSGNPVPPYLADLYQEQYQKYLQSLDGKLPAEKIVETNSGDHPFNQTGGYNKPIYILMDRVCASSCESTIDAFENHPKVQRVGTNTAGMTHFGNIGKIVLPNSKVQVQIPTHFKEYKDKRFIERIGIRPDISVPSGNDAYDFLIKFVGNPPNKSGATKSLGTTRSIASDTAAEIPICNPACATGKACMNTFTANGAQCVAVPDEAPIQDLVLPFDSTTEAICTHSSGSGSHSGTNAYFALDLATPYDQPAAIIRAAANPGAIGSNLFMGKVISPTMFTSTIRL
jgi:Peptidase family S41